MCTGWTRISLWKNHRPPVIPTLFDRSRLLPAGTCDYSAMDCFSESKWNSGNNSCQEPKVG